MEIYSWYYYRSQYLPNYSISSQEGPSLCLTARFGYLSPPTISHYLTFSHYLSPPTIGLTKVDLMLYFIFCVGWIPQSYIIMPPPNLPSPPPPVSINVRAIFQTLSKAKGLSQSGQKSSLPGCKEFPWKYFTSYEQQGRPSVPSVGWLRIWGHLWFTTHNLKPKELRMKIERLVKIGNGPKFTNAFSPKIIVQCEWICVDSKMELTVNPVFVFVFADALPKKTCM